MESLFRILGLLSLVLGYGVAIALLYPLLGSIVAGVPPMPTKLSWLLGFLAILLLTLGVVGLRLSGAGADPAS
jgi:hypothetical protein